MSAFFPTLLPRRGAVATCCIVCLRGARAREAMCAAMMLRFRMRGCCAHVCARCWLTPLLPAAVVGVRGLVWTRLGEGTGPSEEDARDEKKDTGLPLVMRPGVETAGCPFKVVMLNQWWWWW